MTSFSLILHVRVDDDSTDRDQARCYVVWSTTNVFLFCLRCSFGSDVSLTPSLLLMSSIQRCVPVKITSRVADWIRPDASCGDDHFPRLDWHQTISTNCPAHRLPHVSQRKEHPDQKQRLDAVQQPERAAHRAAAPHLLHGGPRQRGQHGQRLLGRPQLFPPSAAVQRAQCGHKHVAHHAGQGTRSERLVTSTVRAGTSGEKKSRQDSLFIIPVTQSVIYGHLQTLILIGGCCGRVRLALKTSWWTCFVE